MKIEVVVLGKNHYDMEGQRGANLVIYGEHEVTNNKAGISISEASIDYSEHEKINVFPAKYQGDAQLISTKSRSGKNVTSLRLTNLKLMDELTFIKKV